MLFIGSRRAELFCVLYGDYVLYGTYVLYGIYVLYGTYVPSANKHLRVVCYEALTCRMLRITYVPYAHVGYEALTRRMRTYATKHFEKWLF